MLSEYLNELLEKTNALTEIDLARIGGSIPKPEKGARLIGRLPEDLQKLWVLINKKREEADMLKRDHLSECEHHGGPACIEMDSKHAALLVEEDTLRHILAVLITREMKINSSSVYVTKNFEIYDAPEKPQMYDIFDILGFSGPSIIVKLPRR